MLYTYICACVCVCSIADLLVFVPARSEDAEALVVSLQQTLRLVAQAVPAEHDSPAATLQDLVSQQARVLDDVLLALRLWPAAQASWMRLQWLVRGAAAVELRAAEQTVLEWSADELKALAAYSRSAPQHSMSSANLTASLAPSAGAGKPAAAWGVAAPSSVVVDACVADLRWRLVARAAAHNSNLLLASCFAPLAARIGNVMEDVMRRCDAACDAARFACGRLHLLSDPQLCFVSAATQGTLVATPSRPAELSTEWVGAADAPSGLVPSLLACFPGASDLGMQASAFSTPHIHTHRTQTRISIYTPCPYPR